MELNEEALSSQEIRMKHEIMVRQLVKKPEEIIQNLSLHPWLADLWHAATGIVGEAGEIIDAVKKAAIYAQVPDRKNLLEELGDIEFYLEQLRQNLGLTREQCLQHNYDKLAKRFKNHQYSDQQAKERNDKKEVS